jgi:hypothetical protein
MNEQVLPFYDTVCKGCECAYGLPNNAIQLKILPTMKREHCLMFWVTFVMV